MHDRWVMVIEEVVMIILTTSHAEGNKKLNEM